MMELTVRITDANAAGTAKRVTVSRDQVSVLADAVAPSSLVAQFAGELVDYTLRVSLMPTNREFSVKR